MQERRYYGRRITIIPYWVAHLGVFKKRKYWKLKIIDAGMISRVSVQGLKRLLPEVWKHLLDSATSLKERVPETIGMLTLLNA
ncbi:hypothetical protein [Thalassoglobus sp.]|uniref:hypothetical protein n=1 Tax=Thalassoglobus sp. TaxID=2795869 RepID=UPI003AA9065F